MSVHPQPRKTVIEVMARAICMAAGDNPDALAFPPMMMPTAVGKAFVTLMPTAEYEQPRPLWKNYMREARAGLEALKDYPPVFGDLRTRKGTLSELYNADRSQWAASIDALLEERE